MRTLLYVVRHSGAQPGALAALLRFDEAIDQTLRPFDESQMVTQAALKQHADAMVARNIGGRDQRNVFPRAPKSGACGLIATFLGRQSWVAIRTPSHVLLVCAANSF